MAQVSFSDYYFTDSAFPMTKYFARKKTVRLLRTELRSVSRVG